LVTFLGFEREFTNYSVSKFARVRNDGRVSFHAVLFVFGISLGDEVSVPTSTS